MRLKLKIGNYETKEEIVKDYRRYFMSLVKRAFEKANYYSEIFASKKVKPYVFSVFLGKDFTIDKEEARDKIKINFPIEFIFSTGDQVAFSHFYNGVLWMKEHSEGLILPKDKVYPIEEIQLLEKKKIMKTCAIFKTMNVCVLTDPSEDAKNFDRYFCTPLKDLGRFNSVLEKRMLEKYKLIKGKELDTKVIFTPLSVEETNIYIRQGQLSYSFANAPIKEILVRHYNGYIKGFKAVFYLESHSEMLQFIYDYGLGVRTGQGFGLLELIAQI